MLSSVVFVGDYNSMITMYVDRATPSVSFGEILKNVFRKFTASIALALVLVFCIASLTACSRAERYFVYGTDLSIDASGTRAANYIDKAYKRISDMESLLSPTIENSDVWRINQAAVGEAVACCDDTMSVMRVAQRVYQASSGAYDPSVYPLVRLWNFAGDQFGGIAVKTPPDSNQISAALELVGLDAAFDIDYDNSTVTKKKEGAMLDFGGVAKGYAVEQALKLAEKTKAIVNLGGNIGIVNKSDLVAIGNPDRMDRPQSTTAYFGTLTLAAGECISTSGDYERYFAYSASPDEKLYFHHILNPITGYPSNNLGDEGLISVTVISTDGALGDAVSTAIMVLGKSEGTRLLNSLGLKGVLISADMSYTVVGDLDFAKK